MAGAQRFFTKDCWRRVRPRPDAERFLISAVRSVQTLVIDPRPTLVRLFDPEFGVYERRFDRVREALQGARCSTASSRRSAACELLAGVRSMARSHDLRLLVLCAAGEALPASALLAEAVATAEGMPGETRIQSASVLERAVASFWSLTNGTNASVRLRLAAELSSQTIALAHLESDRCEFVVMRNGASLQEHERSFPVTSEAMLAELACCLARHDAVLGADAVYLGGERGAVLHAKLTSVGVPTAVLPDARHAALVGGAAFLRWQADLPA